MSNSRYPAKRRTKIRLPKQQTSSHFVPIEDRWRIGFPAWDRYDKGHPIVDDYPYMEGRLLEGMVLHHRAELPGLPPLLLVVVGRVHHEAVHVQVRGRRGVDLERGSGTG